MQTTRRGHRLAATCAFSTGCIATLVLGASPASATIPDHGVFEEHGTFTDPDVCSPEGFSITVDHDEVSTYRAYFDNTGAVTRFDVHVDYRDVISANGHTIVERDRFREVFYPDGTARTIGDTVHIQGPGPGLVQHDAGQILFNADGSVAAIHGPHPQFEGQTFCFALLP